MSYTPDDQRIDRPVENLLESIDAVRAVCAARIRAKNDWGSDHIAELNKLRNELNDFEYRLRDLFC